MSAETEAPIILRQSGAGWISLFVTVLIGALCIFMLGAATFVFADRQLAMGAVLLAAAAVMIIMFQYVLRDARGKQGWRISIGTDTVDLDLPGGRSLIHRPKPVHGRVRFGEMDRVETRLEAYRSFGLANMQRVYALKLKTGEVIILGEDRALGTSMASAFFETVAAHIVERGGIPLHDLGMAEGKGGILAVLFTSPPQWDAPSLPTKSQDALWRRATFTGRLALMVSILVLIANALGLIF